MKPELIISIGSLVVAALAVILGPYVSWRIAKQQSAITVGVARRQLVAPIRQEWIQSLRQKVAEILSMAHWYYVAGESKAGTRDGTGDERGMFEVERELMFLHRQVELMLNPTELNHQELVSSLQEVASCALGQGKRWSEFPTRIEKATTLCQKVLQREWERVKSEDRVF